MNVTRWFTTCINQPEFLKVLGKISLCEKMVPVTAKTSTEEAAAVHPDAAALNGEHSSLTLDITDTALDCPLNIF